MSPRSLGSQVVELQVCYSPTTPFHGFFSISGHGSYGQDSSVAVLPTHGNLTLHFDQKRQNEKPLQRSDHALPEAIVLHYSLKSSKNQ